MSLELVKLEKKYKKQLIDMIDEWREDQIKNNTNRSPWAIFRNDCHDFDNYLLNLESKDESNGRVPDSVFFLYDTERDIFIGAINIRHYLNESLFKSGGHIGDGVRPSERKKGYATKMIALALDECRKLGMTKVSLDCNGDNIGSKKSILNNGGVFERITVDDDGSEEERYWITL